MKLKFPLIAAFAAMLALTACGGGGSDDNKPAVSSPATLTKTDITVGTGAEAITGKRVSTQYVLWLYNDKATDFKGARLEAGDLPAYVIGSGRVIPGYDQGVIGMKVGGKRTVLIPSNQAYGPAGNGPIPGNSGLVYEITLTKVE
ncbi:FKBP-type peptidyl-prolyl cis-trans isomerase [Massilia sp. CFBP9012]|uniref:FKBP-type peptidyl-prolyl cis-trans isomerase n=1 Tax=Massilia sp. CFBP9012 TaxID=3096531 RepID=UPI002A6ABBD1|nr:FKBP-type peptidyl-prolyl cis-trans isomerase [Massilia sp. CFBP9012]MDY0974351.1 FKBP-type peptidyl-prolyl cis-trans isomerase [Massilia sp. CFBP9012]